MALMGNVLLFIDCLGVMSPVVMWRRQRTVYLLLDHPSLSLNFLQWSYC